MTLPEALEAVRQAGAILLLAENGGPRLRGRVDPAVVEALRQHRDRLAAVLALRVVHRAAGFSEDDIGFIEAAMLEGRVSELRIVSRPPGGPQ